ncbi:TMEM175 family protein [Alloacidobacterium dinghuense]|nr:TMEM175 family protein [Alloacidobacterium dinghuense]
MAHSNANSQMTAGRLEAFSDGVIAVIITIMVLEIHVPKQDGLAGLWSVAPRLAVYLLSFFMVGIYWINHHELIRRTESVDYRVLWANLIFLFVLSLVPYFVDYLDEKNFSTFATLLYDVTMLVAGMAFFLLRWAVIRRQWYAGSLRKQDTSELWKHGVCLGIYLLAIAMAFYKPWLSLVITGLVTLVWVVPEAGVKEHRKAPPAENAPIE